MKNPIRAVLLSCGILIGINLIGLSYSMLPNDINGNYGKGTSESGNVAVMELINTVSKEEALYNLEESSGVDMNSFDVATVIEDYEEPETEEVTIESITMKGVSGKVDTEPVVLELVALNEVSQIDYEIPEWDIHARINTINILWEFLVNQQGVSEKNAAAIIGSICCEGDFGQVQKSKKTITSIEEARKTLGKGGKGYGIVQWTYKTRQKSLLEYYELAYEQYPDDWETTQIIAECSMLLEELKAYEIFDDLSVDTTIEDAVAHLSKEYFKYENYWKDWSGYKLKSGNSNGQVRYNYATSIYGYFTDIYE